MDSSALAARHRRVAAAWGDLGGDLVAVGAGESQPIAGTDQYHPFLAHPDFRYLGGCSSAGGVVLYDPQAQRWTLFTPRPDADDLVWHGPTDTPGEPIEELAAVTAGRRVRWLGTPSDDAVIDKALELEVAEARTIKDEDELDAMRRAAAATAVGFEHLHQAARPGRTEWQVETELEVGFRRGGGDQPAYDSIVATGRNAAVLHYGPTAAVIEPGDFLLVDAAAMVEGYACDCTRTFAVGAEPTADQRAILRIVAEAQAWAVERCVPGAEYRALHLSVARRMAEGLVELGVLRGDPEELVGSGAMALFFPHGLGHLIGLSVHDVAGYGRDRQHNDHPSVRFLRADRPLEAGVVVTIEPGIYFIDALLDDAELRDRHRGEVDFDRTDELRPIGGVRIEDTVHVSADGPESFTETIPKLAAVAVA